MNIADLAQATVDRVNSATTAITKDWKILVEIGGVWFKLNHTGTPASALTLMEEFIDPLEDRWARGYDGSCVKASDGVAESEWMKRFGKK